MKQTLAAMLILGGVVVIIGLALGRYEDARPTEGLAWRPVPASGGTERLLDSETGVVCYRFRGQAPISCVRFMPMTAPASLDSGLPNLGFVRVARP